MNPDNVRTLYQELCTSYRAIDDFRAKLLGFLPLTTGAGVVLLSDAFADKEKSKAIEPFLEAIGLFGLAVTLGLLSYEIYGIKKCHALIKVGEKLEEKLAADADTPGQFRKRPPEAFGLVNEPFAAGIIYPAVAAAWVYLIQLSSAPTTKALVDAIWVFFGGFVLMMAFSLALKRGMRWV